MIEDIINSNKILNYEKRGIRLILLIGIISVMSSCSVIYRSIDFVSESDHWKRDLPSYYYMYTNNTDSIGIWAWGTDMSRDVAIFFGPPLFPIIPTAIQVWEKPDRRIKIDLFLNTNQLCNINFDSVSIVDHKGKKITKALVERVYNRGIWGRDSLDTYMNPNFQTTEPVIFRLTLNKKSSRVKWFDLRIESLKMNGDHVEIPVIRFKRKDQYGYVPLILAH